MNSINEHPVILDTIGENQVIERKEGKIFQKINDFISHELDIKFRQVEGYRFIIGESPYPQKSKIVIPSKRSKYASENIPEVALLSYQYTVEMYTLCSILFNSHTKADKFMDWILQKSRAYIKYFAEFLFKKQKLILFNRYSKNNKSWQNRNALVRSLISKYSPIKILIVGKRSTRTFDQLVKGKSLTLVHSSADALKVASKEWCHTYFCMNKKNGNVTMNDFSV